MNVVKSGDEAADTFAQHVGSYLSTLTGKNRADAQRVIEAYNALPEPVRSSIKQVDRKHWQTEQAGVPGQLEFECVRLVVSFGVRSTEFVDVIMGELLTIWSDSGGITDKRYKAALAVIGSVQPTNALEAMLVAQMIASHEAAMNCTAMIGRAAGDDGSIAYGNLAAKFGRLYVSQFEALERTRRGGAQVVKHVHVNEGGQAVIAGTVNTGKKTGG